MRSECSGNVQLIEMSCSTKIPTRCSHFIPSCDGKDWEKNWRTCRSHQGHCIKLYSYKKCVIKINKTHIRMYFIYMPHFLYISTYAIMPIRCHVYSLSLFAVPHCWPLSLPRGPKICEAWQYLPPWLERLRKARNSTNSHRMNFSFLRVQWSDNAIFFRPLANLQKSTSVQS